VAALTAIERALGLDETPRTRCLRGLLLLGGTIESHALHVFALALPDLLGHSSVMSLARTHPDEVAFALRLKQLGNRIQELIGGRAVHPINTLIGGFGALPAWHRLEQLRTELETVREPLLAAVRMAAGIELPTWAVRPTVFMALRPAEPHFRFRGASICTSRGDEHPLEGYREVVRELTVEHSHAKHSRLASGETFMVGSLARLTLLGDLLEGPARQARDLLVPAGGERRCEGGIVSNILSNTWAQLVELVHCVERAIELCSELLGMDEGGPELVEHQVRAGRGIAAIEVPRGTLFHEYALDEHGTVIEANVITPTAQNLANAEADLRHTAETLLAADGRCDDTELELALSMVARAYDPCISCSVHLLRDPARVGGSPR
jgi:sulfhydrogenase subunit alpha